MNNIRNTKNNNNNDYNNNKAIIIMIIIQIIVVIITMIIVSKTTKLEIKREIFSLINLSTRFFTLIKAIYLERMFQDDVANKPFFSEVQH